MEIGQNETQCQMKCHISKMSCNICSVLYNNQLTEHINICSHLSCMLTLIIFLITESAQSIINMQSYPEKKQIKMFALVTTACPELILITLILRVIMLILRDPEVEKKDPHQHQSAGVLIHAEFHTEIQFIYNNPHLQVYVVQEDFRRIKSSIFVFFGLLQCYYKVLLNLVHPGSGKDTRDGLKHAAPQLETT